VTTHHAVGTGHDTKFSDFEEWLNTISRVALDASPATASEFHGKEVCPEARDQISLSKSVVTRRYFLPKDDEGGCTGFWEVTSDVRREHFEREDV